MQAIGLTVYPYRYGRPLRDMGQMNSTLADLGIRKHWLEEYHATFRTAKIRIHTTDDQRNDYEIICTSTLRLEIPVGDGWSGMLRIRIDENGNMCVFDNDNDVRVTARSVWLHHVARND
jgi:hypothetical protein